MTAFELYCDFMKAKNQAHELEAAAKRMKLMNNTSFKMEISNINKYWRGDASEVCVEKALMLSEDIENIADSLCRTAELIRRTAQRVYEAEMKALDIANKRTYK